MPSGEENNANGCKRLSWAVRTKYALIRGALLGMIKALGFGGLDRFGRLFGWFEYVLQYKRRARIYRRLDHIYDQPPPKASKRRIARRFFYRVRCDKMMYTVIDRIDRDELLSRFEIEGRDHLDQAIARGKGTFLMFSHQGSHHLGGILLTLSGYRMIGLRDPKESPLRIYVQEQFESHFPEFRDLQITPSDAFAKTFFNAFQSNALVAAAMDVSRDRGNVRTVQVSVFGGEQRFLSGMTHIALRCQAAILVGFFLSLPGYRYRIIFSPWLVDPDHSRDDPGTVQTTMQQYAEMIEEHMRTYPDQISKTK